jgi:hypothetical protein
MKNVVFYILTLWGLATIAQNKQVLYGLEEVPQSLLLNPGIKVPQKSHFGIPFLSQLHLNGGASGVSTFDIFGDTGEDINTKIRTKIFEMKNTDFFTATQQLEIINFGWRSKKEIYFSGGIYQEFDFISYFPRDLAILAWEGNRDYIDYEFDLGEISTTGDLTVVYHFGLNKKINDKLTAGIRAKLYSSMLSYRSTSNRGSFVTRFGGVDSPNIYEHTVQNAEITVETSGIASLTDLDGASQVTSEVLGRAFFGGNIGIGLDIGGTYEITNRLEASASALDIGAIFHSNDVETYQVTGDYTLNGIELIFPPLLDGEGTLPYYDDLEDEIEREIPVDTIVKKYTQFRPLKLNGSLKYSFGRVVGGSGECDCMNMGGGLDRNQAIGVQLFSIFRPKGPQTAATLFYYRRLWDFLSAKVTYTADSYSFSNVGLGFVGDFGKFNFYVAADNVIKYGNIAKAKSVSLQLGLNIKIAEQ